MGARWLKEIFIFPKGYFDRTYYLVEHNKIDIIHKRATQDEENVKKPQNTYIHIDKTRQNKNNDDSLSQLNLLKQAKHF